MKTILAAALPLLIGFALDCLFGDPYTLPHLVRLIGRLIAALEAPCRKLLPRHETAAGAFLMVTVLTLSTLVPALLLAGCYAVSLWLGIAAEGILCYYLLAARCLRDESSKVYRAIKADDTEGARRAVSMIVGRDTDVLDREGIIKAAVETVAENTSDGVTAPLFYLMLGGAAAGFFYKAANTMDSMIGYKNETYLRFGKCAAKLDDILNFLPSRLTALLMVGAAYITGLNGGSAWRIWRRDRFNHASPNSAQTEAVCAGALGVQLAGDAYYFGQLYKKKTIGDPLRPIENEDIRRANRLMYVTSFLMLLCCTAVRAVIWGVWLA